MNPLPDPSLSEEIDPAAVAALAANVAAGQVVLVDCRESDEWALCHLPGARLVPLSEFPDSANPLVAAGVPCVVYCHHGMRSLRATRWLRAQGLASCFSMAGGIDRWSVEIDPLVTRY